MLTTSYRVSGQRCQVHIVHSRRFTMHLTVTLDYRQHFHDRHADRLAVSHVTSDDSSSSVTASTRQFALV